MSETKFTPGPWFVHDDHPQHACYHIAPADYWHDELATIYSPGDPEADANASLIAAAPELYEALEGLMDHESRARVMPIGPAWDAARAALAKARGES